MPGRLYNAGHVSCGIYVTVNNGKYALSFDYFRCFLFVVEVELFENSKIKTPPFFPLGLNLWREYYWFLLPLFIGVACILYFAVFQGQLPGYVSYQGRYDIEKPIKVEIFRYLCDLPGMGSLLRRDRGSGSPSSSPSPSSPTSSHSLLELSSPRRSDPGQVLSVSRY